MNKKLFPLIYTKNIKNSIKEKSILCLENSYFHIFKITIENVINKEDRILQIEDKLEIIFPEYHDSDDFILRYEILEKSEDIEKIVIYILNSKKLKNLNILDARTKYAIPAILPSFFIVREYKQHPNFYNFDISDNCLVISKYSNFKLEDINIFQININLDDFSYSNIINTFLANIEVNFDIVFTGKKIDFSVLELENKKYNFFEVHNITLNNKNYINFLPENLRKKYFLYYTESKYLILFFIFLILTIFFSIFLYLKISKAEKILSNLENENSYLEKSNKELRDEIAEFEKNFLNLYENKKDNEANNFKISSLLNSLLLLIPRDISIQNLEYDGTKIISLTGTSSKLESINIFLRNIENCDRTKLENHDYIIKKENFIEFKLEIIFKDF